ncbi:MAG: division/cell wall cluster transcriptional repressor MraZ [Lachnospiraceae bacterium]|nr:division/cell wall cluster transcriptional repressor MraZ [Lachnospiraceae bacterium]
MTNYLIGSYQHNIDAKGRLTVPVRLREQLGDGFYVTRGLGGCLFVYPEKEWEAFLDDICSKPLSQAAGLQRYFLANCCQAEPDSMGRILIPKALRDFAGIVKEITFIGVGKRAEIWASEKLQAFDDAQTEEDIVEAMSTSLL